MSAFSGYYGGWRIGDKLPGFAPRPSEQDIEYANRQNLQRDQFQHERDLQTQRLGLDRERLGYERERDAQNNELQKYIQQQNIAAEAARQQAGLSEQGRQFDIDMELRRAQQQASEGWRNRIFDLTSQYIPGQSNIGLPDVPTYNVNVNPIYSDQDIRQAQNDIRARAAAQGQNALRSLTQGAASRGIGGESPLLAALRLQAMQGASSLGDQNALNWLMGARQANASQELAGEQLRQRNASDTLNAQIQRENIARNSNNLLLQSLLSLAGRV